MYLTDIFNHLKRVREAVTEIGGEAWVNAADLSLYVKAQGKEIQLPAQCFLFVDGRRSYEPGFPKNAEIFNGWYPSLNKHWEFSSEKLKFKSLVNRLGLRTPAYWADADARPAGVVIKQSVSSFGEGLRGPFREVGADRPETLLREGEYYEQFVFGWIAKAWFWNGKPVCLKLRKMPVLVGDGVSTVRTLLDRSFDFMRAQFPPGWLDLQDWALLDNVLEYQQIGRDTVAPTGHQFLVDYRYNHCWVQFRWDYDNVLPTTDLTALHEQLESVGSALWQELPDPIRNNTLFTVDAILDSLDRLWFLETNSNPALHPDLYLPMLRGLLCGPAAVEPAAQDAEISA